MAESNVDKPIQGPHPLSMRDEVTHELPTNETGLPNLERPDPAAKTKPKIEIEIVADEAGLTEQPKPDDKAAKPDDQQKPEEVEVELEEGGKVKVDSRLQKRINKEVWRRSQAEQRAQYWEQQVQALQRDMEELKRARDTGVQTQLDQTEARLKADLDRAKKDYLAAVADGDAERLYDANARLAQLAADQKEVEIYKRQRQPVQQQPVQQPQVQQPAATPRPTDPLAIEWAGENPWFGRDKVMTAVAYAIDADLKAEGVPLGTKDFYAELNRRLRKEMPHKFSQEAPAKPATPAQPVAPASRGAAPQTGKVKLTQREVEMAARLGVPPEEYARFVTRTS